MFKIHSCRETFIGTFVSCDQLRLSMIKLLITIVKLKRWNISPLFTVFACPIPSDV